MQNGFGFINFEFAKRTLSGIEVVYMLKKDQMVKPGISMISSFCELGDNFKIAKILIFYSGKCDRIK